MLSGVQLMSQVKEYKKDKITINLSASIPFPFLFFALIE